MRPYRAVTPFEGISTALKGGHASFTIGAYAHKELPTVGTSWNTSPDGKGKPGLMFHAYNEPPSHKDRKSVDEIYLDNSNVMMMDYKCPRIKSQLFYVTMDGYFTADRDGEYQIGVCVFGTAKVFVDGKLLIDNETMQRQGTAFFGAGTVEEQGTLSMKKDTMYHIEITYGSAPTAKLGGGSVNFGGGAVRIGGAWKIDPKEEIQTAAKLAKKADQVVICAGLNMDFESEGYDRPDMKLPGYIDELIETVLEAAPDAVVVMQSGTPVEMPWLSKAKSLLHAWYGGNETGHGIADVLFGDVNPSGKLSLSFPIRNEDNPAFLNYRSEAGRTVYGEDVYVGYRYYDTVKRPVNFAFGHGLSYTTFKFSELIVKNDGKQLAVKVTIFNTGPVDGAQVVQVYVSQDRPAIRRPVKELKEFKKVFVKKGKSITVDIGIPLKYATSYFDESMNQWIMEEGSYKVIVSDTSAASDSALEQAFNVDKTSWWSGL